MGFTGDFTQEFVIIERLCAVAMFGFSASNCPVPNISAQPIGACARCNGCEPDLVFYRCQDSGRGLRKCFSRNFGVYQEFVPRDFVPNMRECLARLKEVRTIRQTHSMMLSSLVEAWLEQPWPPDLVSD